MPLYERACLSLTEMLQEEYGLFRKESESHPLIVSMRLRSYRNRVRLRYRTLLPRSQVSHHCRLRKRRSMLLMLTYYPAITRQPRTLSQFKLHRYGL